MVSTGVSTIGGPPMVDTGRSVDAVQDNNVGHAKVEAKTNEEVAPTETDAKAETDIVSSVFDIVDLAYIEHQALVFEGDSAEP